MMLLSPAAVVTVMVIAPTVPLNLDRMWIFLPRPSLLQRLMAGNYLLYRRSPAWPMHLIRIITGHLPGNIMLPRAVLPVVGGACQSRTVWPMLVLGGTVIPTRAVFMVLSLPVVRGYGLHLPRIYSVRRGVAVAQRNLPLSRLFPAPSLVVRPTVACGFTAPKTVKYCGPLIVIRSLKPLMA